MLVAHEAAKYFRRSGRHFPWRNERDPFRLAVAEILLQKTRAGSVVDIYRYLTQTWSTAELMSAAKPMDIEEVLRPLGLSNKRARQLIGMSKAALDHGYQIFYDWRTLLRDVPGLGAYAARAVACFGGRESVGIVDANVARIVRRLFCVHSVDFRAVTYQRHADAIAEASSDARSTNFGLLDIGAMICLTKPKCGECPFSGFCPRYGVRKRS